MENEITFHHSSPILLVSDIDKSVNYYKDKLGFSVDWIHKDFFASVSREKANIMLSKGDQGTGQAWIYIGVSDTERLFEEYSNSGALIRQKPTNFSWALEIQVEDLDRNVIRFGSEPKQGFPFGPWLDMNGKYWEL